MTTSASPDGVINCTCCGKGVLEIKCPFCHRETSLEAAATNDSKFCLKQSNGELSLDHRHAYYYQVQTQLFVCDVEYADFCVCTFLMSEDNRHDDNGVHIERIYKDLNFWTECVAKSQLFFRTCLLPEIMGNWYTRPKVKSTTEANSRADIICGDTDIDGTPDQSAYCYCRSSAGGTMIGCDNPDCPIEWFHLKCLKLPRAPKGKSKWYCPDCSQLPKFLKRKKKI